MRGLPSSGKSYTARRLAGESGVVCETDSNFQCEVGNDPARCDYDPALLPIARQWNLERFLFALRQDCSPVIVDRGNGLSLALRIYARKAVDYGYRVELREPESPWWQQIREVLKQSARPASSLEYWSERLARINRSSHETSARRIRYRMAAWRFDLTVDDILAFQPPVEGAPEVP